MMMILIWLTCVFDEKLIVYIGDAFDLSREL